MSDASALLAFDTSTQAMAVALQCHGRVWLHDGEGGAAASGTLLPQVRALLAQAGIGPGQLDAIAFGRGPGAFTGLRTSCAVAQGLALGAGRPVLALDSLLLVAEQARRVAGTRQPLDLGVVMDARMGEVYAARWRWTGDDWKPVQEARLCSPAALAADWSAAPPDACTGSGRDLVDASLAQACGLDRWLPEGVNRADALLELARRAWRQGLTLDAAEALPVYVRDKVAQTTAERRAVAAAGRTVAAP